MTASWKVRANDTLGEYEVWVSFDMGPWIIVKEFDNIEDARTHAKDAMKAHQEDEKRRIKEQNQWNEEIIGEDT